MMLSLRARTRGLEAADVDDLLRRRLLVRAWAMRGTIHLLHRDDVGWIVSLLGPSIIKKGVRRRLELGLDDRILADCMRILPVLLRDGPRTRGELADALVRHGIRIGREGQAPYHLVAYAGLKGLLFIGPDRPDGEQTYDLVGKLYGGQSALNREEALTKLFDRYLGSYGPAGLKDLASWSGLSLQDAKKGLEQAVKKEKLFELQAGESTLWATGAQLKPLDKDLGADTVVNLLPAFDALVLGYDDRKYVVPEKHWKEVYHGGQTVPVVLANGQASGTWRYERRGKALNIKVSSFGLLDGTTKALIREEAEDVGRFFGLRAEISGL